MARRVLVVDDVETSARILSSLLESEYYGVRTVRTGADAIAQAREGWPDLIIMSAVLPDADSMEVCRNLKSHAETQQIPLIISASLGTREDRLKALSAGADDFISKPIDPLVLFTRVRALLRIFRVIKEVLRQAQTSRAMGLMARIPVFNDITSLRSRALLLTDNPFHVGQLKEAMKEEQARVVGVGPDQVVATADSFQPEVVCIQFDTKQYDALRIVSQLRALDSTSECPIVLIGEECSQSRLTRALDMGVTDYQLGPIVPEELAARVLTQVRRLRYTRKLKEHFHYSLHAAVTDQLTGLYNRTYMTQHLDRLLAETVAGEQIMALLLIDLDHFKYVNDTWGHQVGDEVLIEFARRLKSAIRLSDTACRYGGEEFVVIMPDAGDGVRGVIAERIRLSVSSEPFVVGNGTPVDVTISVGTTMYPNRFAGNGGELLHQADLALYTAKRTGRNRVVDQSVA